MDIEDRDFERKIETSRHLRQIEAKQRAESQYLFDKSLEIFHTSLLIGEIYGLLKSNPKSNRKAINLDQESNNSLIDRIAINLEKLRVITENRGFNSSIYSALVKAKKLMKDIDDC
ncbi:MAG: hypothetical protein MHMPM18_003348, partial [Marteilia pararefringens]